MKTIALAFLASSALVSASAAQTAPAPTQQGHPAAAGSAQQRAASNAKAVAPQEFVDKAANSNMFEIQSSQFALQRSGNQKIKTFAQRMIDDHTAAGGELKKAAGKDQTVPSKLNSVHAGKLAKLRDTADRFDRTYAMMQQDGHEQAVALFQSYADGGSDPELKRFAETTLPTLRAHLQSIREINADLMGTASDDRPAGEREGETGSQAQATAGNIVVRQSPPTVRVDQAPPSVTVQQPQAQVSVRQQRPEIVVRQPQPTVQIDIPRPEITVRMPKPDVAVSFAKPSVEVTQPEPKVQVMPGRQSADSGSGQAKVSVAGNSPDPTVTVEAARGRPIVRYERSEPRVVVNQPEGQPVVRFEQMEARPASNQQAGAAASEPATATARAAADRTADISGTADRAGSGAAPADRTTEANKTTARADGVTKAGQRSGAAGADQTASSEAWRLTPEQRERARSDLGVGQNVRTVENTPTRSMSAGQIDGMTLYNASNKELGEIDRVVERSGTRYVVVTYGGFLGIGEDRVLLPFDRLWMRNGRLVVRGVTEDDLDGFADYRRGSGDYRDVPANTQADLRLWR